jgi:tRNA threonylcarbamoyladenosine biosynthesis protein TsaB
MKLLAIDTATETCSVALLSDDGIIERAVDTQRGHADLVLPMVEAVLAEAGLTLRQLDGLAYGRGPGAFTGVRIAVGVAQFAGAGARILVCMDARMNEVYWGQFEPTLDGLVAPMSVERVDRPEAVEPGDATVFAGTGFGAYPQLLAARAAVAVHSAARPHARDIARLAAAELRAGRGQPAERAQPVYLRDQVAAVKPP